MAKTKNTKTTKKLKAKTTKFSSSKVASTSSSKKKGKIKTSVKESKQKKAVSKPKKVFRTVTASKKKSIPLKKQKIYSSLREKRIQNIRTSLLNQKESLLNEAEVALNELPGQTVFPDLGDQASAETDRSFMLRLRGREQRLLKKIEEAIDRIENETFGICDECGEEIDIKRLVARPVTTMCFDCKTLQEEEEKLRES